MEFGFLEDTFEYSVGGVKVVPIIDKKEKQNWLNNELNISCGWIYPPLKDAEKQVIEKNSLEFMLPDSYFEIQPTHKILAEHNNCEKKRFLILGIGFFFGVYLLPTEHVSLTRLPYKVGMLTGVIPTGDDIPKAIAALSRYYDENLSNRNNMFAIIHWMLFGQTYQHEWERFDSQCKVLDGLYKVSGVNANKHAKRPKKLSELYGIDLPSWAEISNGDSKFSIARNEFAHEALYAGRPIGYAYPPENFDLELVAFNAKLIAATLGLKSNFQDLPCDLRVMSTWGIK